MAKNKKKAPIKALQLRFSQLPSQILSLIDEGEKTQVLGMKDPEHWVDRIRQLELAGRVVSLSEQGVLRKHWGIFTSLEREALQLFPARANRMWELSVLGALRKCEQADKPVAPKHHDGPPPGYLAKKASKRAKDAALRAKMRGAQMSKTAPKAGSGKRGRKAQKGAK